MCAKAEVVIARRRLWKTMRCGFAKLMFQWLSYRAHVPTSVLQVRQVWRHPSSVGCKPLTAASIQIWPNCHALYRYECFSSSHQRAVLLFMHTYRTPLLSFGSNISEENISQSNNIVYLVQAGREKVSNQTQLSYEAAVERLICLNIFVFNRPRSSALFRLQYDWYAIPQPDHKIIRALPQQARLSILSALPFFRNHWTRCAAGAP